MKLHNNFGTLRNHLAKPGKRPDGGECTMSNLLTKHRGWWHEKSTGLQEHALLVSWRNTRKVRSCNPFQRFRLVRLALCFFVFLTIALYGKFLSGLAWIWVCSTQNLAESQSFMRTYSVQKLQLWNQMRIRLMRRAMPAERGADLGVRADAPPAVQQWGHRETPRRLRGEQQHSEGEISFV